MKTKARALVSTTHFALARRAGGAVQAFLVRRRAPWLVMVLLSLTFWVSESAVHALLLDQGGFFEQLLTPSPHEWWMRSLVVVILALAAVSWAHALLIRRRALAQMRAYQQQLRDASARVSYGDLEDRRELADRLHEHVGQTLTAARFYLASVDPGNCDLSERDALRSTARILERAIAECRDIAQELSPPSLDEYGLVAALETLARRVMRQTGASIEVDVESTAPVLDRPTLLATFGALTEIVEAAASSASDQSVRVASRLDEGSVAVSVTWRTLAQFDLMGASEQLDRVGGAVQRSEVDSRTVVTVLAPLSAA